jgi:hypothetical protein
MNWVRVAKVVVKLIAATPALMELGRMGVAAARAVVNGRRDPESSTGISPPVA